MNKLTHEKIYLTEKLLKDDVEGISDIEVLDLRGCYLTEIPSGVSKFFKKNKRNGF